MTTTDGKLLQAAVDRAAEWVDRRAERGSAGPDSVIAKHGAQAACGVIRGRLVTLRDQADQAAGLAAGEDEDAPFKWGRERVERYERAYARAELCALLLDELQVPPARATTPEPPVMDVAADEVGDEFWRVGTRSLLLARVTNAILNDFTADDTGAQLLGAMRAVQIIRERLGYLRDTLKNYGVRRESFDLVLDELDSVPNPDDSAAEPSGHRVRCGTPGPDNPTPETFQVPAEFFQELRLVDLNHWTGYRYAPEALPGMLRAAAEALTQPQPSAAMLARAAADHIESTTIVAVTTCQGCGGEGEIDNPAGTRSPVHLDDLVECPECAGLGQVGVNSSGEMRPLTRPHKPGG